jgi:hypothetical protein
MAALFDTNKLRGRYWTLKFFFLPLLPANPLSICPREEKNASHSNVCLEENVNGGKRSHCDQVKQTTTKELRPAKKKPNFQAITFFRTPRLGSS